MPSAYFKKSPRTARELSGPRPIEDAVEYEVAETVVLSGIAFENFCADMLVERVFMEKHAHKCHIDHSGVWHCLHIREKPSADAVEEVPGLLVMPGEHGRALYAALAPKI